ncbi:MAG: phosphoribosylformylglycinamidine synthase subunit PurQ [Dongiaceae bacterium]
MKAAIIVFPGSNREGDVRDALVAVTGTAPLMVWHRDTELPEVDLIVVPGGFSYGDYLRCGAIAAHSPVMREVKARADKGAAVLGICNGFQILTETGMLPGALLRNAGLSFVCRNVTLRVENSQTLFTAAYDKGQELSVPVAHHDGNYFADAATLDRLESNGQIAFRYVDNPNGSTRDIAGIFNETKNVLGLMPHPENATDGLLGSTDGLPLFRGMFEALA